MTFYLVFKINFQVNFDIFDKNFSTHKIGTNGPIYQLNNPNNGYEQN